MELLKHQENVIKLFTFHYGPIQISINKIILSIIIMIYIPLWSYSNELWFAVWVLWSHLHSTMVLFKLNSLRTFAITAKAFTFHYGPIQIYNTHNMYILQYIYIPLWSYSNNYSSCNY